MSGIYELGLDHKRANQVTNTNEIHTAPKNERNARKHVRSQTNKLGLDIYTYMNSIMF